MITLQVFTGNRLTDGIVVYLSWEGDWSELLADGFAFSGGKPEARMTVLAEAAAEGAAVVDPYPIEVRQVGGKIRPVRYRERIRAFGPPVHPEFAKQARPAKSET